MQLRPTPNVDRGQPLEDVVAHGVANVVISIKNLSKTYPVPLARLKAFFRRKSKDPVEALRDVSFDVYRGEIFGLIGRNGAGKTTLTKIVATLVQPTLGTVTVNGFDSVHDDEKVRMQVGLSGAEERSFYWRLTSEQNLIFFARLYGLTDRLAKQRIAALFAQLELEDVVRKRFGELSTGNKQRLAVARALLPNPPVLLLDEPTRSLDPLAASRMRELIKSLSQSDPPVTILFTSHNLAEVETLCNRVAIISAGEIRAVDSPANLRAINSDTEVIRLTVTGLSREQLEPLMDSKFDDLQIESGENIISFTRRSGDDQLDEALRRVHRAGGRILRVESERPTLLDVLESYERKEEG
jgi:ABC-2 type transport system ATP-binding protein